MHEFQVKHNIADLKLGRFENYRNKSVGRNNRIGSPGMKPNKVSSTKGSVAGQDKQVFTDFICNFVGVNSNDQMSKTHYGRLRGYRGSESTS